MRNALTRFLDEEPGTAALEYSLIVGGIALAVFAAVQSLDFELRSLFYTIAVGIQTINTSR